MHRVRFEDIRPQNGKQQDAVLKKGDTVLIRGLKGRPDLNGKHGKITDGPLEWSGRFARMHACIYVCLE